LTLIVCGPGHAEQSHHFDTEASLEQFWGWYEQRLMRDGWALLGTEDRRGSGDRQPGQERRRGPRNPK
jgi:hypothetical protein